MTTKRPSQRRAKRNKINLFALTPEIQSVDPLVEMASSNPKPRKPRRDAYFDDSHDQTPGENLESKSALTSSGTAPSSTRGMGRSGQADHLVINLHAFSEVECHEHEPVETTAVTESATPVVGESGRDFRHQEGASDLDPDPPGTPKNESTATTVCTSSDSVPSSGFFGSTVVQRELAARLEANGLDTDFVMRIRREAAGATLRRRSGGGGYEEAPDHEVRLRAAADVEKALQLSGVMPSKVVEESVTKPVVVFVRIDRGGELSAMEVGGEEVG